MEKFHQINEAIHLVQFISQEVHPVYKTDTKETEFVFLCFPRRYTYTYTYWLKEITNLTARQKKNICSCNKLSRRWRHFAIGAKISSSFNEHFLTLSLLEYIEIKLFL